MGTLQYLLRRLLLAIPTLFGITLVTFTIINLAPGDPASLRAGDVQDPEQSERIVAALDAKGVPHAYMAFEGEQHGFRQAETIVAVADAELSFYGQVLGFDTPGVGEPVKIVHGESLEG